MGNTGVVVFISQRTGVADYVFLTVDLINSRTGCAVIWAILALLRFRGVYEELGWGACGNGSASRGEIVVIPWIANEADGV